MRGFILSVLFIGTMSLATTIRDLFAPLRAMAYRDYYPVYQHARIPYDAVNYTEYELTTLEYEQDCEDNGYGY